jgi:hypothetical protein
MIAAPYRSSYVWRKPLLQVATAAALLIGMLTFTHASLVEFAKIGLPLAGICAIVAINAIYTIDVDASGVLVRLLWGVRTTRYLWLQIVNVQAENEGVRIFLADGKSPLLRCEDPQALARAMNALWGRSVQHPGVIAAPYRERVFDARVLPIAFFGAIFGGILGEAIPHKSIVAITFFVLPVLCMCVVLGIMSLRVIEVSPLGIADTSTMSSVRRSWTWEQIVRCEIAGRRTVRLFFAGGGSADIPTRRPQGLLDAIDRFRRGAA